MPRVAVLDDYQGVALDMANWERSPPIARSRYFATISPTWLLWQSV